MLNQRLRRQIAFEAARLVFGHRETEFYRAKLRAARAICHGWVRPDELPSDREIRAELKMLRQAPPEELENLMAQKPAPAGSPAVTPENPSDADRFRFYRGLLLPLEQIRGNPASHPEGDLLYHSLQVFDLARDAQPYDEEFLTAALLHDVGRSIDRSLHVEAALDVLDGWITERTAWLIEHHSVARQVHKQTIGVRARRRLEASEHFDDLMLLARCDRDGRQRGVVVPDVDEALDYIARLSELEGESALR